jgi:hypothetical protein
LSELKATDDLTPMLTEIDLTIESLAVNLDEIATAVARRDQATSYKNALLRNAFAASRAFAKTWSSHFEAVQKGMVELERTASAPQAQTKQRLEDIDQAMLSILPLDQLQRRAADSFQLLVGGAGTDDPNELTRLRSASEAAMRDIDGLMSGVDLETSTALLPDIKLLRESALGSGGLFAVKQAELEATAESRRLIAENGRLSNRLSEAAEAFVATSRRQMEFAARDTISVQSAGSGALALIAALSLVSSVLIVWLYVGRNIVSRLSSLGAGMLAIAAGRRDVAVETHGVDEVAEMGHAVEVFRQNAIERDALLAERADAAARLEQVVDERTGELREALDQQRAIAELLQVINSSPANLAPVFDAMLDKSLRLCEAAFGSVWTCDAGYFDAIATRNRPAVLGELVRQAYQPRPETALGRLVCGERFVHADAAEDESYRGGSPARRALVDLAGVCTYLAVALRKGDALLGAFTIYRQEIRPFTEQQIALMESVADQAVIAMENARLLGELRQRQAELRVTFDKYGSRRRDVRRGAAAGGVEPQLPADPRSSGKRLGRAAHLRRLHSLSCRSRRVRRRGRSRGRGAALYGKCRTPLRVRAHPAGWQGARNPPQPHAGRRICADLQRRHRPQAFGGRDRCRPRCSRSSVAPVTGGASQADPCREDGLFGPADRRHRARDQEPAQFRQQLRRAVRRIVGRVEGNGRRGAGDA